MTDIDDHTFDLELTDQILEFLSNNPKSTILTVSKSCDIDSYQCSRYLDFMESFNLVASKSTLDGIRITITESGLKYLKNKNKKEPTIQEQRADKIEKTSYNLLHRYPFRIVSKINSTLEAYLSEEWQDADKTIQSYCYQQIAECNNEDVESVKKLMIEILDDYIHQ
ncbi:MAG TPA: hypothetical protein VFG25_01485 [Nitrosopumilaceae archaeon]|nr:hypothetical protein [Nitrosopumilaceae archaeon]